MPDAGMFLADRVVVIDHINDDVYVLALFQDGSTSPSSGKSSNFSEVSAAPNRGNPSSCPVTMTVYSEEDEQQERLSAGPGGLLAEGHDQNGTDDFERRVAEAWVEEIARKVNQLAQQDLHKASERMHHVSLVSSLRTTAENVNPPFVAEKSEVGYMKDVKRCQQFIKDGESYEVCLTTQFRRKLGKADSFGLYLTLRDTNPAPYSSWLHFGKDGPCICSSSPERFLQLDQKGVLEAKPIKGTTARGSSTAEDERLKHELQHRSVSPNVRPLVFCWFPLFEKRSSENDTVVVTSLTWIDAICAV